MKKKFFKEDLLNECRKIYENEGISGFLYKNFDKKLYFRLYQNGLKIADVLEILNLKEGFEEYKENNKRWDWAKIVEEIKPIVKQNNFLPPAAWFQTNGYSYLIQAIYKLNKNWENLRDEFEDFTNSNFVTSRNGIRWRSHPEASFSNYLYSRGIKHEKGKKYPEEYAKQTGQTYGYFDLSFESNTGEWIDVEIWGTKPYGHDETHYAYKRELKENFNSENEFFLGIEFEDCYNEEKLTNILQPFIGIKEAYIFEKKHDKVIPTTHWSNADELIEFCREFTKQMPDGIFPSESWLRKRRSFTDRDGETYNTLAIYIRKWIGGVRKLREILEQSEHSTVIWNKDSATVEYYNIYKKYGLTTGQLRGRLKQGKMNLEPKEINEINRIDAAVRKHYESIYDINEQLGIKNVKGRLKNRGNNKMLRLRDAVMQLKEDSDFCDNSYNWYRNSAKEYGFIKLEGEKINAYMERGAWYIDKILFDQAVKNGKNRVARINQNTVDYQNGIILGDYGEKVYTDWGYYVNYNLFRFVFSNYEVFRYKNDGKWICNECNSTLIEKNDNSRTKLYCANCNKDYIK